MQLRHANCECVTENEEITAVLFILQPPLGGEEKIFPQK